jgi:hypothetical protein
MMGSISAHYDWYYSNKNREEVQHILESDGLIARKIRAAAPS